MSNRDGNEWFSLNALAQAVRGRVGVCESLGVCGNSLAAMGFDGDFPARTNYMSDGSTGSELAMAGVSPTVYNFGISGVQSPAWNAAVLPAVIAARPHVIIYYMGQNNLTLSTDMVATKIALDAFRAIGSFTLAVPVFQCAGSAQAISAWNRELKAYCAKYPWACMYLDAYPVMMDESAATPVFKAGYSDDGIHPNGVGRYYFAKFMAPIYQQLFPAKVLVQSDADRFNLDSTSNQLLGNPLFLNPYVTASANCSGNVGADWLVTAPAGFSMQCDVLPANGGVGKKQQLIITAGGPGFITLQSGYFTPRWNTGDILAGASRLRVDDAVGVRKNTMYIADSGTSFMWNNTFTVAQRVPGARQEYLAAQTIPQARVKNGLTQLIYLVDFATAGSATVEAEQAQVLKNP